MNFIIDQGLAYYWGTSMWTANQLAEARDVANRLGAPLLPVFSLLLGADSSVLVCQA